MSERQEPGDTIYVDVGGEAIGSPSDPTATPTVRKQQQRPKRPKSPQLKVHVTQKEIDEAIPRDSGHCMIADAVKAACPTAKNVSVDLQTIRFSDLDKGLRYTYLTPRVGQVALVKFDQGLAPEPFSFRLHKGHVTRAGSLTKKRKLTHGNEALAHTEIRGDTSGPQVPRRVGGKTPPLAAHHGTRRAFGLRGLEL